MKRSASRRIARSSRWLISFFCPVKNFLELDAPEDQPGVVFMEKDPDAAGFATDVNSPVCTEFRTGYLKYFQEDPNQPVWP
jgi:hypothetical protein